MKQFFLCFIALLLMGMPMAAKTGLPSVGAKAKVTNEDTRKDPQLSFYAESVSILAGQSLEAPLMNPNGVAPITYTSSDPTVCMVDESGKIYTALVEQTTVVTVTASFAGNDDYLPGSATLEVGIVARQPLKTPVMTPMGGTYNNAVEVTVSTDDANATQVWYSTIAQSVDEFKEGDTNLCYVVPSNTAKIRIDHSCTLYVMTRGTGTKSEVVQADFVINTPLKASFTTDRSVLVDYEQNFEQQNDLIEWTMGEGWHVDNLKFGEVQPGGGNSLSITYAAGDGQSPLTSPAFDVKEGQQVEFYAFFKTKNIKWEPWTIEVIDNTTGTQTTLFNIYRWMRETGYQSDDVMRWKKFSLDLSAYAGHQVQIMFNYTFDGENLAIDAFRLVRPNAETANSITVPINVPVLFTSTSEGNPSTFDWSFPGAKSVNANGNEAVVVYDNTGTYDVSLTIGRGGETSSTSMPAFVQVVGAVPTAHFDLPSEAYETPSGNIFVPTGVPIQFTDASEGKPTEWLWKFEGNTTITSTEQNPIITFDDEVIYDVSLTVKNASGSNTYVPVSAIQAGGQQPVWNISTDEVDKLASISYGDYGFYAGCNMFGLDRFAEHYKAPLADATIKDVYVFFASTTTQEPNADIELAVYDVAGNNGPGKVLAKTSVKANSLRTSSKDIVETIFSFAEPVKLTKGKDFFLAIGPFPYQGVRDYQDQIAVYCVARSGNGKCTTWDLAQGSDRWIANVSGHASMAIAPILTYGTQSAISLPSTEAGEPAEVKAIYNLCGQQVSTPQQGQVYIVRYANGSARKVVW